MESASSMIGLLVMAYGGPNNLDEVERFSTKYLAKVLEVEKDKENRNNYEFENSIKNASEFVLKFEPAKKAFSKLVFKKIENQVKHLKSQLCPIQKQLSHQERIFARIELRRQGRELLTCQYKKSLGCLGSYQCDNCQINYSVADNNQITEISQ